MTGIPSDFGGLLAYWDQDGEHAYLVRFGKGKPIEGLRLTALNLLQARNVIDDLIEQGEHAGNITEEHRRQSGLMPTTHGVENILDRSEVDRIAGEG